MLKFKESIEKIISSYNDWFSIQENREKFRSFKNFIILVFIISIITQCYFAISYTNTLNDYFLKKYDSEIVPKSEMEINSIVNETKLISNVSEKLNRIAEWETSNFTDLFWEKYLHHDIESKFLNPPVNSYRYEKSGKIRAESSFFNNPPFLNDPYWIQYNRFGACGEESALFANVTNRSGYATRIVGITTGFWFYGIPIPENNHEWVEVNIDDEWYFFDPTVYGEYNVLKIDAYKDRWFGKTFDYDLFTSNQVLEVIQMDTRENISQRYPKLVNPPHETYEELGW